MKCHASCVASRRESAEGQVQLQQAALTVDSFSLRATVQCSLCVRRLACDSRRRSPGTGNTATVGYRMIVVTLNVAVGNIDAGFDGIMFMLHPLVLMLDRRVSFSVERLYYASRVPD